MERMNQDRRTTERLLEVCIDSLESVLNGIHGGADELEVCSSLTEGGLTPSAGLVKETLNEIQKLVEKRAAHEPSSGEFCLNTHKLQKPKKPMTKEEVTLLLDLVASKKVIVSKETNAATNKLKEEAWNYVTTMYNAKCRRPRHKEQLKLKWDNLKKSARKRSQKLNKMVVPKVNVMLRCRAGSDFCYSQLEMDTMLSDLEIFKAMNVDRFVFGALDKNGDVDVENCRRVIEAAAPIPVTFHRAFDVCNNALESLDSVISLGFDRLLTSGQAETAISPEGVKMLENLQHKAENRIQIMPGAGITSSNVGLIKRLPFTIFHGSCKMKRMLRAGLAMGSSDSQSFYYVTDKDEVARLKKELYVIEC